MDGSNRPRGVVRQPLEDHPDLSLFMARLYQRLGGSFEIDATGHRYLALPDPVDPLDVPQPHDASRQERFRSVAEWRGATRLVEYWLNRLGPADKERVFTALAATARGEPGFDFRAML